MFRSQPALGSGGLGSPPVTPDLDGLQPTPRLRPRHKFGRDSQPLICKKCTSEELEKSRRKRMRSRGGGEEDRAVSVGGSEVGGFVASHGGGGAAMMDGLPEIFFLFL
ncbi:hypothetical protein L484_018734 [Morus notabilis]|uniref:Uncharacterized protein n=1 Tax=Morus notabilis TaxID=981085 RepID=W9RGN3_9ROSA|nr:hypothetical protein L484_018734 [Morus notabilis]